MLDLRRYVPDGRVSTGLLGWYDDRLVWAVGRRRYWRDAGGRTLVPLIGVGGGQEDGESLIEAVQREALEEANAPIVLVGARRTVWVDGENAATAVDLAGQLAGEPAPVLIWQVRARLIGDAGVAKETGIICPVYEAIFGAEPTPGAETPALLFTYPRQVLALGSGPVPLEALLAGGASCGGPAPPREALLFLEGSPRYLARYWDKLERGDPQRWSGPQG